MGGDQGNGDEVQEEEELRGGLNDEQVALALENVGHLFGDGGREDSTPSVPRPVSPGARKMDRGRARVDSSARPAEFYKPGKFGKMGGPENMVDYRNFSVHGISEPALRARLESKAIDKQTVDRVRHDFEPHDKLSEKELASLEEMVAKAHKLHVNKDEKGAEKIYQEVLNADPVHYECLTNLAKISYAKGDLQKAIDLFERAIVVRPQHDKTVYHLAIVLFDMKNYERAQSLFNEVVQGFKGDTENGERCDRQTYHNAIAMLGLIHQSVHQDHKKAMTLYDAVLKWNPDHVLTLDHKCALLAQSEETRAEAARMHKRVCILDPNHTKKVCPYLDALFPRMSGAFHENITILNKMEKYEHLFFVGAKKKSWTNNPWRSLMKKIRRTLGLEAKPQPGTRV